MDPQPAEKSFHFREAEEITERNVKTIAAIKRSADANRTMGERVADIFARGIGSWPFIIIQTVLLVAWVVANVIHLVKPWDPYPFILLNLALSFQAAYASPIIMMSQNRQARVDEERNHLALQIDLLAEQEDTETLLLLQKICAKLEIPIGDKACEALAERTDPNKLIEQIKREVKNK